MIVADVNLIAYFLIPGEFTVAAEGVRMRDSDWTAPELWATEFLNVLATNVREGCITREAALAAWAEKGAKEGNPKDAPAARRFEEGWNIPKPDLVLQMAKPFQIPASGTVDYHYVVLPTKFTEDKWVRMSETRPTDRSVVHHMVIFVRDPQSKWLRGEAEPGIPFVPPKTQGRNDIGGALPEHQRPLIATNTRFGVQRHRRCGPLRSRCSYDTLGPHLDPQKKRPRGPPGE